MSSDGFKLRITTVRRFWNRADFDAYVQHMATLGAPINAGRLLRKGRWTNTTCAPGEAPFETLYEIIHE